MEQEFGGHRDADASMVSGDGGGEQMPVGQIRRRPRLVRVLIAAGVMLVLAAGAVLAGGKFFLSRYVDSVHQEHLLGGAAATPPASVGSKHDQVNRAINLLLVGTDEQAEPASGARSDSIIIAHIPTSHDHAYLISVPRDSRVEIPPYRKTGYPGGTDKINAAFAYGFAGTGGRTSGFELLALTIKQLTGISFNAGAIINFDGLRSVVDAVGGVDMCVDEETAQAHAGCQHFAGSQALAYARERSSIPDGDYGRQRHQQQLIAAIARKISTAGMLADPFAADRVLRAMGNAVTFDGNGTSLTDWIFALKGIDPNTITMIKTNGGQYNGQVIQGQDFEILTDTTRQLFGAAHDDTLSTFVANHPDWVINNPKR